MAANIGHYITNMGMGGEKQKTGKITGSGMFSDGTNKRLEFVISTFYFIILAGLVYVAYRLVGILLPFIIAFILAALLRPLILWIHHKLKVDKKVLSIFLTSIIYIGAGALLFLVITQLVILLRNVLTSLPDYYNKTIAPLFFNTRDSMETWLSDLFEGWQEAMNIIQARLTDSLQSLVVMAAQAGTSLLSGLWNGLPGFFIGLLFTILLSFPIGTQYDSVAVFLLSQIPENLAESITEIRGVIKNTVLKYLLAQLILLAITCALSLTGLLIIGVPNAVGMSLIIAFFDMLPVFGPGSVMIPWVIVETFQGHVSFAVGLAIVYAVITLVRNSIAPRVVGTQLGLHPIISLLSIYVGYRLLGIFGMISFPIIIQVLIAMHNNGQIRLFRELRHPVAKDGAAESDPHNQENTDGGGG